MEICLIIMAIVMIAIAGLIVFLSNSVKTLQNHALKATEAIVNIHERVEIIEKAELRRAKKEFDAKKKKKIREE